MKINPPLILHYFKRTGLYVCVNYTQHTHGTCSNLASKLPGQEHQARMFSRGLAGLGALGLQRKPRASGKGGSQEAQGLPWPFSISDRGTTQLASLQAPYSLIRREFLRVLCRYCINLLFFFLTGCFNILMFILDYPKLTSCLSLLSNIFSTSLLITKIILIKKRHLTVQKNIK